MNSNRIGCALVRGLITPPLFIYNKGRGMRRQVACIL